jgi:hypothetical protein
LQQYCFQIDSNLIKQERQNDNILINRNNNGQYAVLYFSSNGLYFPNDEKTFKKIIMQENRFEWTNPSNRIQKSSISIYVRDLYKQWYIKGINSKIDSIEKMVDFFKESTKNKKIITVGSSSGGYAATLFGILLNADYVFNSKLSDMDEKQFLLVKDHNTIYPFGINSDAHGIPFDFHDLKNVLNSSKRKLIKLNRILRSRTVTRRLFTQKFSGFAFYSKVIINNFLRSALQPFR